MKIDECCVDISKATKEELEELHNLLLKTEQKYWNSNRTLLTKTNETCMYYNLANSISLG